MLLRENDILESRKIVRMYSSDLKGRLPIGAGSQAASLILLNTQPDTKDTTNPWRKLLSPDDVEIDEDPVTKVIAIKSKELCEKWLPFLHNGDECDRLVLNRSEPTIEGVVELVKDSMTAIKAMKDSTRRGKAMNYFHRFCRASVNHERIAEGLGEALCIISEGVAESKSELNLYRTPEMLQLIADFYAQIFAFLSDVMEWITRKRKRRFLDSFNEDFLQKFEKQISRIKSKSDQVKIMAAQESRAEQRKMMLVLENVAHKLEAGQEVDARFRVEMALAAETLNKTALESREDRQRLIEESANAAVMKFVSLLNETLRDEAVMWLKDMRSLEGVDSLPATRLEALPFRSMNTISDISHIATPPTALWSSDSIALSSRHLEDFFHRDRVRMFDDRVRPTRATPVIMKRLSEWMGQDTTKILWIEGPSLSATDGANPISVLSTKVVELAEQAGISTMSYCCELRRGEDLRPGNSSREAQASVAMMCALIRQMIELLEDRIETAIDLSETRFQLLDGCSQSWPEMMRMFCDLLSLIPEPIFCVVEGLHWLDDRSTLGCLEEFVRAVKATKMRGLFTTTGRSACLRKQVHSQDTLIIRPADLKGGAWGTVKEKSWVTG
ncbi:hypothetical protein F5Y16DRAFT_413764 [Xylariaceae sp. FL0255]|nr:hypothetical protein F5Y16DRAFT_413764 [Xylariaceae sp. FL0255]